MHHPDAIRAAATATATPVVPRPLVAGFCPKCNIRVPSQLISDLWKSADGLPCPACRVLLCPAVAVTAPIPEVVKPAPKRALTAGQRQVRARLLASRSEKRMSGIARA